MRNQQKAVFGRDPTLMIDRHSHILFTRFRMPAHIKIFIQNYFARLVSAMV